MKTDVSDRWSIARGKVEDILALRLRGCGANPGPWAEADAKAEHLRLVLEIERQRAADRQAAALERTEATMRAMAMSLGALVATGADLAAGLNALVATIKSIGLTVEDLADQDQGELFEDGACACGKDHSAVG